MRVYIGWDQRESRAFEVAAMTASRFECEVVKLDEQRLRNAGLLTRPVDRRHGLYDFNSGAPCSTDFALSRFFVPLLAHSGWVLFTDCDVVFLRDPWLLPRDPSKAVMVVKHRHEGDEGTKMDGQPQTQYARKNWSSVVLWNCDHPANKRLTLTALNNWPGRDLHAFGWLHDDEIGELSPEWNWLVGVQPKPARPAIAHFTLGGPWIAGWERHEHDEIWHEAEAAVSPRL